MSDFTVFHLLRKTAECHLRNRQFPKSFGRFVKRVPIPTFHSHSVYIIARFLLQVKNYDIKVGHIAVLSGTLTGNNLILTPLL